MSDSYGPYEVVGVVAAGSTGTVYRARHAGLDRDAAIKELSVGLRRLPGFVERFRAEAETLAGLDHPNVVAVYDYVEEPERAWIAEEWVDGASLEAIITSQGRLSPEQSLGVMRGALTGLAHAHDRGLVHRDIAPGNILADLAGTSKLVDFGLAAPVGDAAAQGTPAFISPEAAHGEPVGKTGDVYSAASVLFALLSGQPPFPAADVATTLRRHIEEPPPALSDHGPDLADLLRRSMDKDPAVRPPDAGAFLAELEEAAKNRFGAGWLPRASIAGLVAATSAGGVAAAGGTTGGVAGGAPTVIVDIAAAGVGGLGAANNNNNKAPKGGLLGLSAAAAVALAAAVVLVLGGGAFAAVKLAGGASGEDAKSKQQSAAAVASAKAAALAARAPSGVYVYRTVLVSSNYPGAKVGVTTEETLTLTQTCTATSCSVVPKTATGSGDPFTWDGTQLGPPARQPEIASGLCVDSAGKTTPGTNYKATTTYVASPLRATDTGSGGSGPPDQLTGTYDIMTEYTELTGNCNDRSEQAHYTITLTRKR